MEEKSLLSSNNHKLIGLIQEALYEGASHHKQWYIEQMLECFFSKEYIEEAWGDEPWEKGIAP